MGEIWVRGDGQDEASIEVHTTGAKIWCSIHDNCYNGEWLLGGVSRITVTSETDTYSAKGRCVGERVFISKGENGRNWVEWIRMNPNESE